MMIILDESGKPGKPVESGKHDSEYCIISEKPKKFL